MITGVHVEIVSKDIQEAYAFLRDKLGLPCFDAGGGFLIFDPPEVELAVAESGDAPYEPWFICDDIEATIEELEGRGVTCEKPIQEEMWGRVTKFNLPSGRSIGLYERKYSKTSPVG